MSWTSAWTTMNLRAAETYAWVTAWLGGRVEAVDERGGGRNSDEGFHIGAGAIIGGTIAAAVGAYVADRLGLLSE
jgi:hypothetical protein